MPRTVFDPENAVLPLSLPPVAFPVTAETASRWEAGLGGECHAARALGERGLVAPYALTGLTIFLMSSHFDITGGVYWREQVTYHRPPRVGETLSVAGRVERTFVHDGRHYRQMTSHTTGPDRTAVASSQSTGLMRYLREEGALSPAEGRPDDSTAPTPDESAAAANPAAASLRSLVTGRVIVGPDQQVTLQMMRDLSAGDERNPIHTDPEVARAASLRAPIAGGPHVLAFLQEAMMQALDPQALSHGAHFDVRWVSPVHAGQVVSPRATVIGVGPAAVTFDLRVDSDGRTAMVGTAVIPLPPA